MKRLIPIFLFCVLGLNLYSQTDQGTKLLGGSISFQATSGTSIFLASPDVGLFIKDEVAIGTSLSLLAGKNFTAWSIGPFTRIYFGGSEAGKFFGQVGINIGGAKNTDTKVGFGLAAGYAIFLNENVALDCAISYNKAGNSIGIFSIGIGVQAHFHQ